MGLLVRKPGETLLAPYELESLLPAGSTIVVQARMSTQTKTGESKAAVLVDVLEGAAQFTERLEIRCDVQSFFVFENRPLQFGDIDPGETPSQTVTVRTRDGSRVGLKRLKAVGDGFTATLAAAAPDQDGRASEWTIRVTADGTVGSGVASAKLTWQSDVAIRGEADRFHSFTIQPVYRVRPPLEVSGTHVSFGLIHSNQQLLTRTVTLRANHPLVDPLLVHATFERVEGQPASWSDGIQLRVLPSQVEGEATLKLTLPERPEGADGSFRGRVLLDSGVQGFEPIEVLFTGVCRL